jgi:hypothetical protein
LEKEENLRIENREISEGVLAVEVFFYPEEGETIEQGCIKKEDVCVV